MSHLKYVVIGPTTTGGHHRWGFDTLALADHFISTIIQETGGPYEVLQVVAEYRLQYPIYPVIREEFETQPEEPE